MNTIAYFATLDANTAGAAVAILTLSWAVYTYFKPWGGGRPILVRLMRRRMPVTEVYVLGPDGTSRAPDHHGIVELPRVWSRRLVQICGRSHDLIGDFRVPEPSEDLVTIELP